MKRLTLAVFALATCVACSGDDADSNNMHDHDHANHMNHDTDGDKVDVYADGLMKMTESGHFHVMLMGANPAPPDVGENSWTIRVMDMDDNVIDGAKVTVTPFMPAHGHGTSPADYTATQNEDGDYEVGPFDLFMPGVWETTVRVEGEMEDLAKFSFELEG